MAKRLILSMLAMLAGLFAQIGPAQASPCAFGASEIGVVIGEGAEAIAQPLRDRPLASPGTGTARTIARPASAADAVAPTVRIGIDRARE